VESSDDKEVEDGDCLGVSFGEAEMEFAEDEGEESMVTVRSSACPRGLTVDDMVRDGCVRWMEGNNDLERCFEEVVEGQLVLLDTIDKSTIRFDEYPCRFTQRFVSGQLWNGTFVDAGRGKFTHDHCFSFNAGSRGRRLRLRAAGRLQTMVGEGKNKKRTKDGEAK